MASSTCTAKIEEGDFETARKAFHSATQHLVGVNEWDEGVTDIEVYRRNFDDLVRRAAAWIEEFVPNLTPGTARELQKALVEDRLFWVVGNYDYKKDGRSLYLPATSHPVVTSRVEVPVPGPVEVRQETHQPATSSYSAQQREAGILASRHVPAINRQVQPSGAPERPQKRPQKP